MLIKKVNLGATQNLNYKPVYNFALQITLLL
jgi:hypothetical protein